MDWKIEVVTIPISDVDRARDFYVEKVGFEVDIDHRISDEVRLVQLTPPGSACSVHLGRGTVDMEPGDLDGVFLVVRDVRAARADLLERGVEVGEFTACSNYPECKYVKQKSTGVKCPQDGGEIVERIELDRPCYACMLGGEDGKTLFMVAADMTSEALTGQVLTIGAPSAGVGWP